MQERPDHSVLQMLFMFLPAHRAPVSVTPSDVGLPNSAAYARIFDWWRNEAAHLAQFVVASCKTLPHALCHNDCTPADVWWLGRIDTNTDPRILVRAITFLRLHRNWLAVHEQQLIDLVVVELVQ